MSLDVQLEDTNLNNHEEPIMVVDKQVQHQRKRASVENDDTSTQLKVQKKNSDLPFFDPKRSPFMGRSNDISLITRQSVFEDYVDGNDLAKLAAKMSREQLGQQVEFLLSNSPDVEKEDWREIRKVIRSVWRRKSHRNLKIVTDPKINSVLTSLLKSVHYHGDSLFLFNNKKFNVRVPRLMRELEEVSKDEFADVINMSFGEDSETLETLKSLDKMAFDESRRIYYEVISGDDYLSLKYARKNEDPPTNISLFDHSLAHDSNVKNLAKQILPVEVEEIIGKAIRSVTSVKLDYSLVWQHVTRMLYTPELPSPAHELMECPETFAASVSFFKAIFYGGAHKFKFFPKVFLDWYELILSALKDDKVVDGVLMLTHHSAATENYIRNESSRFQSIQANHDPEDDQVSKSSAPLPTQKRVVSNNLTAEKVSTERAPVAPPLGIQTAIAEKPHTKQQQIPPIVISSPQPATPQTHPILGHPFETASLFSTDNAVSLEEILKETDSSKARLVATLTNSDSVTEVISEALLYAKFNPKEHSQVMELVARMLEGENLGNVSNWRFNAVLEAFRKSIFYMHGKFFYLDDDTFEKVYDECVNSKSTNIPPTQSHQQ